MAVVAVVATVGAAASADASSGLTLGGDWSEPERAAVVRALARVPEVVRGRLPVSVARDATSCDADGLPDDDFLVDRRGVVHLCAATAAATTEGVARQVVLGLLFAFDRASGWSEEPAWRRLARWRPALSSGLRPRAENVSEAAFAHARGRRSPRWDLTTFLAAAWLDAPDASGGVACRLMSQAAFVRARLTDLGVGPEPPACPLFERWAEVERLADVEVVLAEPSTAMAGSLFGHVFLRLVYRDEAGETPPHLSRTVAFLADNDVPFEADRGYALKGIAGLYTASLHERAFLEAFREYAVTEARDLRRWRLAFTPAERAALMARLWTVLNGARYDYYFFRQNCATLMMELLDEARAPSLAVGRAGLLAAPPASTLEAWAAARGANGGPLLVEAPEPVLSFDHEARLTSRHRRELEPRLLAHVPPGRVAALTAALRDARSGEPGTRAAAYAALAGLLEGAPAAGDEDVATWLRDSAAIEAHLSVVANLLEEARADARRRERVRVERNALVAALTREGGAIAVAVGLVGDDDPARRLEGYRALRALIATPEHAARADQLRLLAVLESEARFDVVRLKRDPALRDALLFADPDKVITAQPYLAGREDLIALPLVTTVAPPLLALQRTRAALAVGAAPEASLTRAAPPRDEQDASLPRSGIDQVAVSAGAFVAAGAATGALVLGGALYDEALGDHRRFGFPSDTAFVVGRSDVWLARGEGSSFVPAIAAYEARVFGYRSLRLPLPEAGGGRWPVGWQLFVDLAGSRARRVAAEARAGWGVLLPLFGRDELSQHVLTGMGLAYVGVFPTPAASPGLRPQALALPFSVELRAALGARPAYRSWLASRVALEPSIVLAGAARRFATTARADLELHLALGARPAAGAHDPALLVRLEALRTSLTATTARADTQALLSLGVELR